MMKRNRLPFRFIVVVACMMVFAGCERDHYYNDDEDEQSQESPNSHDHDNSDSSDNSDDSSGNSDDSSENSDNSDSSDNSDTPDSSKEKKLISIATMLRGQWRGTISTQYYDDYGQLHEGTYDVDLQFDQYKINTYNGRGVETDYENGVQVYKSPFSWNIDASTEDIQMEFDDHRNMTIITYHLDETKFSGTMKSTDGLETDEFNLTRYTFSEKGLVFDIK